jgi:hypothetical protein
MFVRWQGKGTRWSAVLVESRRVNGKPRQQHVACLGSIDETQRGKDFPVLRFWGKAWRVLDRLGNRISETERERIEQSLAVKVPPMTRDEYKDRLRKAAHRWGFQVLGEAGQEALRDEVDMFPRDPVHATWIEMRKPRCLLCGEKADRAIEFSRGMACVECIEDGAGRVAR